MMAMRMTAMEIVMMMCVYICVVLRMEWEKGFPWGRMKGSKDWRFMCVRESYIGREKEAYK